MNDIKNAVSVLVEAGHAINKNSGMHGETEKSFQMIADLWSAYLHHVLTRRANHIQIEPHDVARMMELLKIARSTYGDPTNRDNYIDSAGYAALASILQSAPLPDRFNKYGSGSGIFEETEKEISKKIEEELNEKSAIQ